MTISNDGRTMRDYQSAYRNFSVASLERQVLQGSLDGGVNVCVECCDRWADSGRVALNWAGRNFSQETVTFADLQRNAARFANLLGSRGISRGDVVATLLPRIPELLTVILGTWRAGAIYQPLFTAFGPVAIGQRVTGSGSSQAKLIVTDESNRPKLDEVPNCPPVLQVDRGSATGYGFAEALDTQSAVFEPVMLKGDDPCIMIFTSGTTGHPKGVRYRLRTLLPVAAYMLDGLDIRSSDRLWCAADPGWAYGMHYAVQGALLLGHATTMYEGGFSVDSSLRIIAELGITNLAAAPTFYRLLMAAGEDAMASIAGQLRVASSVGEPLNPEVVRWAERVLRCPLHDHYGQTELGMPLNNHHGLQHSVKPGSAGVPMPGFELAIVDEALQPVPAGTPGILAVHRQRSPLFTFAGYSNCDSPNLRGEWHLTGDRMLRDPDGHYFFVGRDDDIITSSGYRIGPFDVESALLEHPAVAEVAVIGKPDPERTEIVKAFVVLRHDHEPSDWLIHELQQHVRKRLSLHAYPREVEFIAELPKTPSGKVQRFMLRQRGAPV